MTAPMYRSQPAHEATMPVVTVEIDSLTTKLENLKCELDDAMVRAESATASVATWAKWARIYQVERDAAVEEAGELRRELDALRREADFR